MKMRSILVPLLLTSGSVLYAVQFPVLENQSYEPLVIHAKGLLAPLPKEIKDTKDRLQALLAENPNQKAISETMDELVALHLRQIEMNLTLIYVDRAAQFGRICEKKLTQLQHTIDALKNQEPLRATSGVEPGSSSLALLPEAVMPERVAPKQYPVVTSQEEPEEPTEPTSAIDEESEEEKEEKLQEQQEVLRKQYATKGAAQTALYKTRLKEIQEEALELKEQEKQGTAPVGWLEYIKKKYQETKDWYFGTGTESLEQKEE